MRGHYAVTNDEVAALSVGLQDQRAAWLYRFVSQTQLSIARHFGGITVNGKNYVYFPETDELIRDDVLAELRKMRKAKAEEALDRMVESAQQMGLYDDQ